MKILIACPIPLSDRGGVQAAVTRLAASLRDAGHRIVEHWPDAPEASAAAERWALPLEAGTGSGGQPALMALPRAGLGVLQLGRRLAAFRPGTVNLHFLRGQAVYYALLKPVFGYRLVLSAHGSDLMAPPDTLKPHLRRILRAADAVTVVSRPLRDAAIGYGADPGRVVLVPNGVDTAFWTPDDSVPQEADSIVAAGRLVAVKGYDLLLEAMTRLPARVTLTLYGQGEAEEALMRQAEALGVKDRVRFAGHADPGALREAYRRAGVVALPSRSEGMPLGLIEALACGTPAVATHVGGVPDVLDGTGGAVVPAEDVPALAAGLEEVLARPHDPVGPRRLAEGFSATACDARMERVLLGLDGTAREMQA
ncbi:glycosyltransferase family 4 protein [Parvularcula oceani]|uniref:glycosyltransferase family 4 protein n=1 Tax=Parvularcula oceani TaxID=1247963 RepID=UPI00068DEACC|nr:glycosyltransferase family 4 protein [Parvularcula oceani]